MDHLYKYMDFGLVVYYLALKNIKTENKGIIFIVTAMLGGITEYLFSYMQEKLYGTISWDYSYLFFNLNGRTSLLHCTYWGIGGIIYKAYVAKLIDDFMEKMEKKKLKVVTLALSIFMVFDITISCAAATRQTQRREKIEPQGKIDLFLDKYYPDEYMDKIFANKKTVSV